LLLYHSNGCVSGQGIRTILYTFLIHYHLLHMGTKLWLLGAPSWQHPTLTCSVVCLLEISMLKENGIARVEILH
jgi:hypothetical protein